MSRRVTLAIIVALFAIVIALPGYQMVTSVFPPIQLFGVEEDVPMPHLSWKSVFDLSYQLGFERWFSVNIGFKGFLVRTANQVRFSFFDELPQSMGTRIIVGRGDVLFEGNYVDAYLDSRVPDEQAIERFVSNLEDLKKRLLARNVQLLLVISPSKVALYPEDLPPRYYRPGVDPSPSVYRVAMPLLQRAGITVIDSPRLLEREKEAGKYAVFPRCGTHWSTYACAVVCQQIGFKLQELLGKQLPIVRIRPVSYSKAPRGSDADLLLLANLWFPERLYDHLPYPPGPRPKDLRQLDELFRPRTLIVGSSFSNSLIEHLDAYHMCSKRDFYYYFKSYDSLPSGKHGPIDPGKLDWEYDVFAHDVIILEINQVVLDQAGFGFVEAALARLP